MKTCVSSYSFQPMLSSGELTQLQLIGKVKEMGFDGIEFIDLLPEDGMSVEEYAKRLRDESEKKNLPIVNYTIGAELLNRKHIVTILIPGIIINFFTLGTSMSTMVKTIYAVSGII